METKFLNSPDIQNESLTAYILRNMTVKERVIKDTPENMELANLMQQLNEHAIPFQITDGVRLKPRVKEKNKEPKGEPEGSLQCSQELSNCPHPEPDQFSPHHPISCIKNAPWLAHSIDLLESDSFL
jgi:hypothetical protein